MAAARDAEKGKCHNVRVTRYSLLSFLIDIPEKKLKLQFFKIQLGQRAGCTSIQQSSSSCFTLTDFLYRWVFDVHLEPYIA